jgi:hypothetical protein
MDEQTFDALTRLCGRAISRRGAMLAAVALVAGGVTGDALADDGCQHKKQCQRRRRRQHRADRKLAVCAPAQAQCSSLQCCAGLTCQDTLLSMCASFFSRACCVNEGKTCKGDCDCCTGLLCNQNRGSTCSHCATALSECQVDADCCSANYVCGANSCADGTSVCCGAEGARCGAPCQCCQGLTCNRQNQTCVKT